MFLGIQSFSNIESANMMEQDLKFSCYFLREGTLGSVPNFRPQFPIIHTSEHELDYPVLL